MTQPQIVAPPPSINQGENIGNLSPEQDAATARSVTAIFDKILPPAKGEQTQPPQDPKPPVQEPVTPPVQPPVTPPQTPVAPERVPATEPDTTRAPSFIEEQLRGTATPSSTPPAAAADDWPEEPPQFETPEARTAQYRKWRSEYQTLKREAQQLRERPAQDPQVAERVKSLETENKTMSERLAQLGVEQNMEFQKTIMQPMHNAWNAAATIVKEAGGDPQALAKALNLTGQAQYQALDEVYSEMPESAKLEAQNAVTAYKHFAQQRAQALKDAPKTQAELKKRELQRNYDFIQNQKKEMSVLYDNAIAQLRDEAKLEVLQKSSNPDDQWWNDQADRYVAMGKELFLENTDFKKMAFATALAPFADVYRKLWFAAVQRAEKAEGILAGKFGREPSLSESGGNMRSNGEAPTLAEDLKKPFGEVFLREFHKQRASGVT